MPKSCANPTAVAQHKKEITERKNFFIKNPLKDGLLKNASHMIRFAVIIGKTELNKLC